MEMEAHCVKLIYSYKTAMLSVVFLVSAMFGASHMGVAASTNHTLNLNGTSLLKVNEFDVLYCAPIGPYVNKEERLMAPLRSVAELLGAKVDYNVNLQEAVISWRSSIVVFKKGQKTYEMNGKLVEMDTQPEVIQDAFIIPLGVLLRSLNIPFEYKNHKVIVEDPSFNQSKVLQRVTEFDNRGRSIVDNPSALDIQKFKFAVETNASGETRGSVTVSGLNRTGSEIKEGKEDLHIVAVFNQSLSMEADLPSVDIPDRKRPKVDRDGIVTQTMSLFTINDPLRYVLAAGRTLKSVDERG